MRQWKKSAPFIGALTLLATTTTMLSTQHSAHAAPAPQSQRFAAIDTNYPIPATNVVFVDASGNDGAPGTRDKPFRTIKHAYAKSQPGGTVVVNSGTYREGDISIANSKGITIQAAPHANVWLKGSAHVQDWKSDGKVWKKTDWRPRFCKDCVTNPDDRGVHSLPDQLFVNEEPQRQVGSRNEVVPGTFFVDEGSSTLYMGSNPSGATVEVSQFGRAIEAGGTLRLLGINVSQYSPVQGWNRSDAKPYAVFVGSPNSVIENGVFAQSAFSAVHVNGPGVQIRNNRFVENGANAFDANRADRLTVENNEFTRNNNAGLKTDDCGAHCTVSTIKITHSDTVAVRGNKITATRAPGIWNDEGVINATITGNYVSGATLGIFEEVSSRAIIASNIVERSHAGIYVSGSDEIKVWNNTLSHNYHALWVWEDNRVNGCNAYDKAARKCTAVEEWSQSKGLKWNVRNVEAYNNIFGGTGDRGGRPGFLVPIVGGPNDDGTYSYSKDMVTKMDSNVYFRGNPNGQNVIFEWDTPAGNDKKRNYYTKLADIQAGTGFERNGIETPGARNTHFVNDAAGDSRLNASNYTLAPGSPAIGSGTPLPPDVAAAIGAPAGGRPNRGALVNRYFQVSQAPGSQPAPPPAQPAPEQPSTPPAAPVPSTPSAPAPPPATPTQAVPGKQKPVAMINAGGYRRKGKWEVDRGFTGGTAAALPHRVDRSRVQDAAPAEVYHFERFGNFSYNLEGLRPGQPARVRLHFNEFVPHYTAGTRVFAVKSGDRVLLEDFDIVKETGAPNRAIVKEFILTPDSSGKLPLEFVSKSDNAKVSGIEVLQ